MEVGTFCTQHAVAVPWHAQKVIVRTDLSGEAQDSGWTQTRFFLPRNGTNGHEQPRSVSSGFTRSNRVKTRPLIVTHLSLHVRSENFSENFPCRSFSRISKLGQGLICGPRTS